MKVSFFCLMLTFFGGIVMADQQPVHPTTNKCPSGYALTQYGCAPQGYCPVGQAMYYASCIPTAGEGSNSNTQNTQTIQSSEAKCISGYALTEYGCLPQGACPVGYGQYNNACIALTTPSVNPYGRHHYSQDDYSYPYGGNNFYWYYGL